MTLSRFLFSSAVALAISSLSLHAQSTTGDVSTALAELSDQREVIADDRIPLALKLGQLQDEVNGLRDEAARTRRINDASALDLNSLVADVKARQDEIDYLTNLALEYLRSLESRLHPAELPAAIDALSKAFVAVDDPELDDSQKWGILFDGVESGLAHVDLNIGGAVIDGSAVAGNAVLDGEVILFGPTAYFTDGSTGGLLLEGKTDIPRLYAIPDAASSLATLASTSEGFLPSDPTMGRAIAIEATHETLLEHIQKGGIWIYPILGFALVSFSISVFKFFEIWRMKVEKGVSVRDVVVEVRAGNMAAAEEKARALPKTASEMILAGLESSGESKELLEEVLVEKIVEIQPKLERLLPIVQVTAATAPLLGLLGTVTGMINTFKLITIFGTGDAKQLSGGISEALITTEFGLVVAIPSLIAFAILNRFAKSTLSNLEKLAMSFVNGISASK
jgi:biopolymer transport protein ExbB|tara:strand:- start:3324 stop:4679 length:1356 start_codon:yes stop_codon:yes gene_type:complete